jgi:hypothetical protein
MEAADERYRIVFHAKGLAREPDGLWFSTRIMKRTVANKARLTKGRCLRLIVAYILSELKMKVE